MIELSELLRPPTKEESDIIREALNEDKDRVINNVKLLEYWISYQKHLPQNYDRRILYAFIRGCKQDMEKSKRKIEMYFAIRSIEKEIFADRVISWQNGDLDATSFITIVTLPEFTPEGWRVNVIKVTNGDVETFDQRKMFRFGLMFADFRAHVDNFVGGEVLIFDQGENNAALAAKNFTPTFIRVVKIMQDIYPALVKQVHIVTDRVFLEKSVNVLKYVLKEKIRKRIHVHRTHNSLLQFIPERCLPSDYGGSQKSLQELNERWKELYIQEKKFIEDFNKIQIHGDVPRRLLTSYNSNNDCKDDFGIQGSFRRLNID